MKHSVKPNLHETETMLAAVWNGPKAVELKKVPKPLITDPTDVLVRVTSMSISGHDLDTWRNKLPETEKGGILGTEFIGVVQEIGVEVKKIQKGDRVVVSFNISCGTCQKCKLTQFNLCEITNECPESKEQLGYCCVGMFGASQWTGGYPGGHSEIVRVPFADANCLIIPTQLTDEQAIFLSSDAVAGLHACLMGHVTTGTNVAIWGCGPVGMMAAKWACTLGANRCLVIDNIKSRLQFAQEKLGCVTLNFDECDIEKAVAAVFSGGPDVCIDAAGFSYCKSLLERIEVALELETDQCLVLQQAIKSVKKGGRVSIIAEYFGVVNQFPIGAVMEKGLTIAAAQTPTQKYWKDVLQKIIEKKFDCSFLVTHRFSFNQISEAYDICDSKQHGLVKVVLKTGFGLDREKHIYQGVKQALYEE